eukprot:6175909-Pleurochrysis_carterae.AAC.2
MDCAYGVMYLSLTCWTKALSCVRSLPTEQQVSKMMAGRFSLAKKTQSSSFSVSDTLLTSSRWFRRATMYTVLDT